MKTETLLEMLGLGLRTAQTIVSRSRLARSVPDTRVDRIVKRVLPAARKALDRVAPERRRARRRSAGLRLATAAFLGAASAGAVAYVVVKEQQRVRERYRPVRTPFPVELLDVLSAPGGGRRLEYSGSTLIDRQSGAVYSLLDSIPDFIAPPPSPAEQLASEDSWLQDLVRPMALMALGRNSAGNAAFASAVAAVAGDGWVLSAPSGRGTYEIELAQANPRARVLCLNSNWDVLLEARRRANAAGLTNVYYVRGTPRLLPIQDRVLRGIWTGGSLHRYRDPERELTQLTRAAQRGALVAGVSLVQGGSRYHDTLLRLAASYVPGLRTPTAHYALLEAVGLRDVRLIRDGAFVRFMAVRT